MTRNRQKRTLNLIEENDSLFTEVYSLVRSYVERERKLRLEKKDESARNEERLHKLAVDVFRLERAVACSGHHEEFDPHIKDLKKHLEDLDVEIIDPSGEILSDRLLEQVELLGGDEKPNIEVPRVDRVDRPIVKINARLFRGTVRAVFPLKKDNT